MGWPPDAPKTAKPVAVHLAAAGNRFEAGDHAGYMENVYDVSSITELILLFEKFLRDGVQIDYLDFHAHGHSGHITLQSSILLDGTDLERFRNQGFHKAFTPWATIKSWSCNLVADGSGEWFIAELAELFLQGGGGVVEGSTSACWHRPFHWLWGGSVMKCDGELVRATYVPPNGIHLSNHYYLDANRISRAIKVLESMLSDDPPAGVRHIFDVSRLRTVMSPWDIKRLRTDLRVAFDKVARGIHPLGIASIRLLYEAYDTVNGVALTFSNKGLVAKSWGAFPIRPG